MKAIKFYGVAMIMILLSACDACHKSNQKLDVSHISLNIEWKRFEQDFFTIPLDNPANSVWHLNSKYPDFTPFYFKEILGLGDLESDSMSAIISFSAYRNDTYVKDLADTCLSVFNDFSSFKKEIELAFKYFKYYFPEKKIPPIYTFTGNFTWRALSFDTLWMGIGLDMYLGKNYKYYPSIYPQYIYEKFEPEYLVPNLMEVAAGYYFNWESNDPSLIAQMIAEGKKLYFLDLVLPDIPDYLKIGYLEKDIKWCEANETKIWAYFIEHDLLYKTENKELKKYIGVAPNTSGMPFESPGNIGAWVGWQIVRTYMKHYPETTYEKLLHTAEQEILQASKYKPKT